MFGGLTKTSSRIAIAAALGLVIGGFAFKATPARAADLGGDCCADLEERVAELEATTVRKGNKKVSVTISGWVVKSFDWWDDGDISTATVGDKGYDLGTRFAITGSATIAPGWSAGYNLTVLETGDLFATSGTLFGSNQFQEVPNTVNFDPLYSFIYIKSDRWGALNWGLLSPASDNPAVLADISGTVIESNAVFFEGASFFLRPKGGGHAGDFGGLSGLQWEDFLQCQGLGLGIGADCFGAAQTAVRYDSPTWGGFRFETSWGKQNLTSGGPNFPSPEFNFWDFAAFYTADWNSIKLSAAYAFTWQESAINSGTFFAGSCIDVIGSCIGDQNSLEDSKLHQIGASILHKPSGLGIYGLWQHEEAGGGSLNFVGTEGNIITGTSPVFFRIDTPDTDAWYVKPFWRKVWGSMNGVGLGSLGATTIFGEWGRYEDQFSARAGDICSAFAGLDGTTLASSTQCLQSNLDLFAGTQGVFVTGSEVDRWGLGVVQEIDAAAMHLFARWQHQDSPDLDLTGFTQNVDIVTGDVSVSKNKVHQSFEDWDLFQVGGIIFF